MLEGNRLRFNILKYFPVIGIILIGLQVPPYLINITTQWFQLLQLLLFAGLLYYLHLKAKSKLKFAKVGPDKIVVEEREGLESEYKWNEVESINRRLSLYRLQIKNKDSIYFPSEQLWTLFADNTSMGNLIRLKKSEFGI